MKIALWAGLIILAPSSAVWIGSARRIRISLAIAFGFVGTFAVLGAHSVASLFVSLPFNLPVAAIEILALSALLWFVGKTYVLRGEPNQPSHRHFVASAAWLMTTIMVSGWMWWRSTGNRLHIPNHDAIYHAGFIRNIARFETLQTQDAYFNYLTGRAGRNMYPLSFHAFGAIIQWLTNQPASEIAYVLTALLVVVAWPISVFCFVSFFLKNNPVIAAIAAMFTLALHQFPIGALGWGGIPMVLGGVLLLFGASAVTESLAWKSWLVVGVVLAALGALVAGHTSEAFLLPIFVASASWQILGKFSKPWVARTLVCSSICLALAYPLIERAVGSSVISNLASVAPNEAGSLYGAVGLLMMLQTGTTIRNLWPLLFLAIGFVGARDGGPLRRATVLYLYCFAVALLASQATQPGWSYLSHITAPWYRQFQRLSYFLVPAVVVLAAVGVEGIWEGLKRRRWMPQGRGRTTLILAAVLPILGGLFVWDSHSTTITQQRLLFQANSPLTSGVLRAPDRAGVLRRIGGNVLASFDSGIAYWNIDYDVPVLAAPFLDSGRVAVRELLLDGIVDRAKRPDVRDGVRNLDVRFVATNSASMSGAAFRPSPIDVELSGNFTKIWSLDGVAVWRLKKLSTAIEGTLAPWDLSNPAHPKRWAGIDQISLAVHNSAKIGMKARVVVPIYQNSCGSLRRVVLGRQESQFAGSDTTIEISIDLGPDQTANIPIVVDGEGCPLPESGQLVTLGLGPILVTRMK